MAKVVGFSPEDAKRIAKMVAEFEKRLLNVERQRPALLAQETRIAIDGELTSEMTRCGNASMAVNEGGEETGEEYTITDTCKIAAGVLLPIGCSVTAVWANGKWILISYDCDMEGTEEEEEP